MEVCSTSWTYNPQAITKVASSDGTAHGNNGGKLKISYDKLCINWLIIYNYNIISGIVF